MAFLLTGANCYPFCPFTPPLPFDWPSGVVGQTLGLSILVALLTLGVSLLWIGSAADNDQIFVTSYCRLFWGVWSLLGCLSFRRSGERRFGRAPLSRPDGLSSCKLGCPAFPWSPPYHGSAPVPCRRRLFRLCVAPGLSMPASFVWLLPTSMYSWSRGLLAGPPEASCFAPPWRPLCC